MTSLLATWQNHPGAANFTLPTDPAERDRYILTIVRTWVRSVSENLSRSLSCWQVSTGADRDEQRHAVRHYVREYRAHRAFQSAAWQAHSRDRGMGDNT